MLLERKGRVASRCRFDSLSLHSDNTAHSDASEHWSSCYSRQLCRWFKGITNLSILTHVSTLNTGETEKTDDEFMVSLSCRVNWRSVHASWDPLLKRTKLPKKKAVPGISILLLLLPLSLWKWPRMAWCALSFQICYY